MELKDLAQRANILHKWIDDKSLLLYEDHRYFLNVLYFVRHHKIISEPVNILRFDRHDDFLQNSISTECLEHFRNFDRPLQEFWNFTEFNLSFQDDNWVTVGCDLGLIKDIILIGAESDGNIPKNNIFPDKFGNNHTIKCMANIWHGLEYQGWLSDWARATELRPFWNMLGWERHKGGFIFNPSICPAPLVIDFDLDCFVMEYDGMTVPIPDDILYTLLRKRSNYDQVGAWNTEHFLSQLMKHCTFITVCLESDYCGGLRNSHRILQILDDCLFDNRVLS